MDAKLGEIERQRLLMHDLCCTEYSQWRLRSVQDDFQQALSSHAVTMSVYLKLYERFLSAEEEATRYRAAFYKLKYPLE